MEMVIAGITVKEMEMAITVKEIAAPIAMAMEMVIAGIMVTGTVATKAKETATVKTDKVSSID